MLCRSIIFINTLTYRLLVGQALLGGVEDDQSIALAATALGKEDAPCRRFDCRKILRQDLIGGYGGIRVNEKDVEWAHEGKWKM